MHRDEARSIIGRGTRIEGNVHFSGALRVEGSVHGEIRGAGGATTALSLGREGAIVGSVAAAQLHSEGRIEGSVASDAVVALMPESVTRGELSYESLEVHRGAVVECLLRPRSASHG